MTCTKHKTKMHYNSYIGDNVCNECVKAYAEAKAKKKAAQTKTIDS